MMPILPTLAIYRTSGLGPSTDLGELWLGRAGDGTVGLGSRRRSRLFLPSQTSCWCLYDNDERCLEQRLYFWPPTIVGQCLVWSTRGSLCPRSSCHTLFSKIAIALDLASLEVEFSSESLASRPNDVNRLQTQSKASYKTPHMLSARFCLYRTGTTLQARAAERLCSSLELRHCNPSSLGSIL